MYLLTNLKANFNSTSCSCQPQKQIINKAIIFVGQILILYVGAAID